MRIFLRFHESRRLDLDCGLLKVFRVVAVAVAAVEVKQTKSVEHSLQFVSIVFYGPIELDGNCSQTLHFQ